MHPDRIAGHYAVAIDDCRTVKDAVALYADALQTYGPDGINWGKVNRAFLSRWSASSLDKVKREAWKRIKQ